MPKEINTKLDPKVVAILKKDLKAGEKYQAIFDAGVPKNQLGEFLYRLEHVADPSLKLKATGASIKQARANGVRWERIAYRTGLYESEGGLGAGIAKAKELMIAAGGDPEAYVGRGRRFDGSGNGASATKTSGTKTRGAASGRRGAAAKAAPAASSGRRGAAAKTATTKTSTAKAKSAASKTAGRRGTRAQAGADPK